MLENKKMIIFDFDGTIVDSVNVWDVVERKILIDNNQPVPEDFENVINSIIERGTKEIWEKVNEYIISCAKLNICPKELQRLKTKTAIKVYQNDVLPKENVLEYIAFLKKSGYKLGIVSSQHREIIDVSLKKYNLIDLFEIIVAIEDVDYIKPSPEGFLKVISKYDYNLNEYLVFEDSYIGIKAAKTAGLPVCLLYDKYQEKDLEKNKELADYYIKSYVKND